MLRRNRVNPELENSIITAFITSTPFLEKARKWYRPEYFSDYGKVITKWVIDYWDTYHKAPGVNITYIYSVEHEKLNPLVADNVAMYLDTLNDQYECLSEFNIDFMLEEARGYFREKSYEHLFNHGRELIYAGKVDDAAALHEGFRETIQITSRWENPFDKRTIIEHYADLESGAHTVFSFRGALGELTGELERGWLVAFLGPMKRGKSFWLQEAMFQAARSRKRVAYINLEMGNKGVRDREYKRLTGLPDTTDPLRIPMFDCFYNQTGECPNPTRRCNDLEIRDRDGNLLAPWSTSNKDYRVCAECRRVRGYADSFIPDVWYQEYKPGEGISQSKVLRTVEKFVRQYGDMIRQITYPAFSVTMREIQRDLDELYYSENFMPDMVVCDYVDIIAPENKQVGEREHLNQVWQESKRCAGERSVLWVTGSQTNRTGMERDKVKGVDTAGDIRKLAHIDAMFAINQTEQDRDDLVTRIGEIGAHRHKESGFREVMVLHQLAIGAPYLDSEWL